MYLQYQEMCKDKNIKYIIKKNNYLYEFLLI